MDVRRRLHPAHAGYAEYLLTMVATPGHTVGHIAPTRMLIDGRPAQITSGPRRVSPAPPAPPMTPATAESPPAPPAPPTPINPAGPPAPPMAPGACPTGPSDDTRDRGVSTGPAGTSDTDQPRGPAGNRAIRAPHYLRYLATCTARGRSDLRPTGMNDRRTRGRTARTGPSARRTTFDTWPRAPPAGGPTSGRRA